MTDAEQLIAQAREIHAKAMNCSDFADEGQWRASEDVIDPPLHNYWRVTAFRAPRQKDVGAYPVTKALTQEPAVAGLLTFVSTALPQFCDLVERLQAERDESLGLRDRIVQLEAALKPFAALADKFAGPVVEVSMPHPENPSGTIVPIPTIVFARALALTSIGGPDGR